MKKIIKILAVFLSIAAFTQGCSRETTSEKTAQDQQQPADGTDDDEGGNDSAKTYPEGVSVTAFTDRLDNSETCSGYIATVDFSANSNLRFNVGYEGYKLAPTEFFERFELIKTKGKPCIVVNGGYFSGPASVSLAITGGIVRCHNILSMNWPSDENPEYTVYPVRSAFGQMDDGSFEAQWVYCVRTDFKEYYAFPSALGNNEKTQTFLSSPPTTETEGGEVWSPEEAIGGGPMLVRNGQNVAVENYWAEVLDSGGTAGLSRQPRTAIGVTEDNSLIMLVCDGRGMNGSSGYTLSELADKLISLGAVNAINLDGGGSSAIVGYDGKILNRPSDSGNGDTIVERKVMTGIVITEMPD